MKLGIFGDGKLGKSVTTLLNDTMYNKNFTLCWVLGRNTPPPSPVDVCLDASVGSAVKAHVEWAIASGVSLVVGATGYESNLFAQYKSTELPIGIMTAPNFSLGAAFVRTLATYIGAYTTIQKESSLAIYEQHHKDKVDAPSGTAKLLAQALCLGNPAYTNWTMEKAEKNKIQIASSRFGSEVGFHEVYLESGNEVIRLSHQVKSRVAFAHGALAALSWVHIRKGLFTFDDMAAEMLHEAWQPCKD